MPTHPLAAPGRIPVADYDGTSSVAPTPRQATDVAIQMRDGVMLAAHVYLPDLARHQAVPVILARLPYDKGGRYTFWHMISDRFTAHGFAVVVQDVRGKFGSEGETYPFRAEVQDGKDTLDWIIEQEWCDGNVGMFGDSYYGFTQWAAASTKHPALKAIVPRVTSSDLFVHAHPDAIPSIPMREWLAHTFAHQFLSYDPYTSWMPEPAYHAPLGHESVEATIRSFVEAVTDGSLQETLFPEGWPAASLEIPALHISGWYDNCLPGQLREWRRARDSPAAAHQYLRVNSTDHEDFPWRELGAPLDNHEEDDDATTRNLDGVMVEVISFLDHYLRGRPGRWSAPTVQFEVTNGLRQVADVWPPSSVGGVKVALTNLADSAVDRGRLTDPTDGEVVAETESVSWTHDPRFPVPFVAESEFGQCADLPDESYVHARPDVLVFDAAPTGAPIDIWGPVTFRGTVNTAGNSTHLVARLLDLYPTGEARLISYGAAVVDTSNGESSVDIDMQETAYRVRPGHALRLVLSTSCFPLYAVHPGTDADPWDTSNPQLADQTLATSPTQPAYLHFNVR